MTHQTIDWADRQGDPREQSSSGPSNMADSWNI